MNLCDIMYNMKKIILTATAESIDQAKQLLELGVDRIYVGQEAYGLRLAHSYSQEELRELADLIHQSGRALTVAANGLFHQEQMDAIAAFLDLMKEIQVDFLVVGDTGLIYKNKKDGYQFPIIYDTSVFVTSSRQVNFWKDHGVVEAVLARELPREELASIGENLAIPGEILVYGPSVIHHSKRPLLDNYYNFIQADSEVASKKEGLFLSEPGKPETHYSIFQDLHGTHIFKDKDISMLLQLEELLEMGYDHWKLDGLFTPGQDFVAIVSLFCQARDLLESGSFSAEVASQLAREVVSLHPQGRELDTGFYEFDKDKVK